MLTNSTSLVIQHEISMKTATRGIFKMYDISSLKFRKLCMIKDIPGLYNLYMLQLNKDSMNILTALENCIQSINYYGRLPVFGWYKRGVINDKSLIAS